MINFVVQILALWLVMTLFLLMACSGCEGNYEGDTCDTCARGWTGPQCTLRCDYNCQNCTWDPITFETACPLCRPDYYSFNKRCETCNPGCEKNTSSDKPACDPTNGICEFGCKAGWAKELCNVQCQTFCVNRTCDRPTECCTLGCINPLFSGCTCIELCNSGCVNNQCFQNKSCILGCKLDHWDFDCSKTCSPSCAAAPDDTTSTCDRDGICMFGCKRTHWGANCSKSCPNTCVVKDCDSTSGHCQQGCERGYWNQSCDNNCSTDCLHSDCYHTNGSCKLGCPVGRHGLFCNMTCPVNCLNDTCFWGNGTCALGCEKGFTGDDCTVLSGEVICSPTCQEAPANETYLAGNETVVVSNKTLLTCNVKTLECLYGCKKGYVGERCQFRCAANCSDCQIERCEENCNSTCNDTFCSQSELCVEGCPDGFYGQNCSLSCPEYCINSTCHRENGSCLLGCKGEFLGESCDLFCSPNCENGTKPICNETTLKCLHGCKPNYAGDMCDSCQRGQTGRQCDLTCDYNCQTCTWNPITFETACALCRPDYYYFNNRCEQCNPGCEKNNSSDQPACDPTNGICEFGCKAGWATELCNVQCQMFCVNETCDRSTECCTLGCINPLFGGCKCAELCNSGCVNNQCFQNKSCILGCKLDHWGFECSNTCSTSCAAAPDDTTSTCDIDGICMFGCKRTHWGADCSKSCPNTCVEKDCDATSGHCQQGCERGYWNQSCDNNCSTNCLASDCYHTNGSCKLGCPVGRHGLFCNITCPVNCLDDTCFWGNGTCALGCEKGFTGDDCTVQTAMCGGAFVVPHSNYEYNDAATEAMYSCHGGYEFENPNNRKLQCPESGTQWNGTAPVCKLKENHGKLSVTMVFDIELDINFSDEKVILDYRVKIEVLMQERIRTQINNSDVYVKVLSLRRGSLIADSEFVVADTPDVLSKVLEATVYLLQSNETIDIDGISGNVLRIELGNEIYTPDNGSAFHCTAFITLRGSCAAGYECVVTNGVAECRAEKPKDNFGVIIGVGVGVPIGLLTVVPMVVLILYIKRKSEHQKRYTDRGSFGGEYQHHSPSQFVTRYTSDYGKTYGYFGAQPEENDYGSQYLPHSRHGFWKHSSDSKFPGDFMYHGNLYPPGTKFKLKRPQIRA